MDPILNAIGNALAFVLYNVGPAALILLAITFFVFIGMHFGRLEYRRATRDMSIERDRYKQATQQAIDQRRASIVRQAQAVTPHGYALIEIPSDIKTVALSNLAEQYNCRLMGVGDRTRMIPTPTRDPIGELRAKRDNKITYFNQPDPAA